MKRSSFKHYSLNQAKRHQLEVKTFLGVNYSTQKFLVSDGHAIDLKNYVYKDGIIQKRNGYEQLFLVDDFEYIPASFDNPSEKLVNEIHTNEDDKQINGIWLFEAEDKKPHIIAHIGKLLYEILNIDDETIEVKPITLGNSTVNGETRYLAYEFENFKSFAFVGGSKLWFLGGNKYMCIRFQSNGQSSILSLFPVEDSEFASIPTTTMSITYKNSIVNRRQGFDNVNLLTKWRKNKFISGTTKAEDEKTKTTFFEYTLDAPLIVKNPSDTAGITLTIKEQGEITNG